MKSFALPLLFMVTMVFSLQAQDIPYPITPEEFDQFINFNTTLEDLNLAIAENRLEEYLDRVIIFEGTVASAIVYNDDPADYYAELELITGQWEGLTAVEINRAYVILAGAYFAGRVQERAPRVVEPQHIIKNMKITIAGIVHSIAADEMGNPIPLLLAYDVRKN